MKIRLLVGLKVVCCAFSFHHSSIFGRRKMRNTEASKSWFHPTLQQQQRRQQNFVILNGSSSSSDNNEQDLFEYFDPLLSPHAYPNGVTPETSPLGESNDNNNNNNNESVKQKNVFGIDYMSQKAKKNDNDNDDNESSTTTLTSSPSSSSSTTSSRVVDDENNSDSDSESNSNSKNSDEMDLFEYFDPLLSPHAYPNGISPETKVDEMDNDDSHSERYDPLQLDTRVMSGGGIGVGVGTAATGNSSSSSSSSSSSRKEKKKVGILLMDHGSRNPKSNKRLHKLAELYQLSLDDHDDDNDDETSSTTTTSTSSTIVVTAAHMEITTPSIPDGLQTLLDQGVDEIVCHPYFLSPGRHVTEDIPEIVEQAIKDLNITIPIITTSPVGANTQLMIGAIHSSIREHSQILRESKVN